MRKRYLLKAMLLMSMLFAGYSSMDMLSSSADFILKTNREINVKMDMYYVGRYIQMEYIDSGTIPGNVSELVALLRTYLEADGRAAGDNVGKDMWGTHYRLVFKERGFDVVSAGPDRKWKTDDDIRFEQMLGGTDDLRALAAQKRNEAKPPPRRRRR